MSGPSALAIELSQRQQAMLQQILRRHTSSQRLVRRVQIILKANRGENNRPLAKVVAEVLWGLEKGDR